MRNHWKSSKFVKWIRGYEKPHALTWQGWDEWEKETRAKYPVRYWFAEDFVPKVQDFVTWPATKIRDIRHYINNRWITRSHALTSNLERGQWHDLDTRLMHCMFDELVNFVEIEQAWMQVMWGDNDKKYQVPWYRRKPFGLRVWRCPEAGVDRLLWAAALEEQGQPTRQAIDAKETLELYRWWKEKRPARRDPHEVSGWSKLCSENSDPTLPNVPQHLKDASLAAMDRLEHRYQQEDEQMMIRLIKIRRSLWS